MTLTYDLIGAWTHILFSVVIRFTTDTQCFRKSLFRKREITNVAIAQWHSTPHLPDILINRYPLDELRRRAGGSREPLRPLPGNSTAHSLLYQCRALRFDLFTGFLLLAVRTAVQLSFHNLPKQIRMRVFFVNTDLVFAVGRTDYWRSSFVRNLTPSYLAIMSK